MQLVWGGTWLCRGANVSWGSDTTAEIGAGGVHWSEFAQVTPQFAQAYSPEGSTTELLSVRSRTASKAAVRTTGRYSAGCRLEVLVSYRYAFAVNAFALA